MFCHNLHYPLAEFQFDTSKDSKEIVKKVASNIHQAPVSQIVELEDSRKTQKSKYRQNETLFFLQIKKNSTVNIKG